MSWDDRVWCFIRDLGFNPETAGPLIQVAGIMLFVITILWYIHPFLPDEPPKKRP